MNKRTSLAAVEDTFAAAINREDRAPVIPAAVIKAADQARMAVIGGFSVRDDAEHEKLLDQARSERWAALGKYREDRATAIVELGKAGVVPLAVVPAMAWRRLLRESGLYRLTPSGGKTCISMEFGRPMYSDATRRMNWAGLAQILIVATVAISLAMVAVMFYDWHMVTYGAAGIAVVVGIICAVYFFWNGETEGWAWMHRQFMRPATQRFAALPWKEQLQSFFPDGKSTERGRMVGIILPDPPPEVAATLLKLKDRQLNVSVVPDAFAFDATPEQLIWQERHERVAAERERLRALREDPIIDVEFGSAVAIVAQFGDFPIEQQTLERVVNSEHLV